MCSFIDTNKWEQLGCFLKCVDIHVKVIKHNYGNKTMWTNFSLVFEMWLKISSKIK